MKKGYTHAGIFHADDIMASAILLCLGIVDEIVRVFKVPELELKDGDVVFDVGMKYDGVTYFDHHQENSPSKEDGTPYASVGLILEKWGGKYTEFLIEMANEIDLVDNGCKRPNPGSFISVISMFNPINGESVDGQFEIALRLAMSYVRRVMAYVDNKENARNIVLRAFEERESYTNSNHILLLEEQIKWQEHLLEIDKEGDVLFVVFPDVLRGDWKTQAVPTALNSMEFRKGIREDLWGKHQYDIELVNAGTTFVHKNGFIAASINADAAINLAHKSLYQL